MAELERVTKPGGSILMLAPYNYGNEEILSPIRDAGGYEEFDFDVPCDGKKPAFRLPPKFDSASFCETSGERALFD